MGYRSLLIPLGVLAIASPAAAGPSREWQQHRAAAHYEAGLESVSEERFDEAELSFRAAVRLDPLHTRAHCTLGETLMALRSYAEAVEAFTQCRDAFHVNEMERVRGANWTDGSLSKRLDGLSKSLKRPTPPAISLALGSAHFRAGNLGEAEAEYLAALAVDPKLGEAHNNLAVIYMLAGSLEDARERISLAESSGFRVNPNLKQAAERQSSRSAGAP